MTQIVKLKFRNRQNVLTDPNAFLPERGHAREEFYTVDTKEEFGLHKRTRRVERGDTNVTSARGVLLT